MLIADFLTQALASPFSIPICAIVCVFVWLSIASISEAVAKVMCNRNDTELKADLLARGFTAEEMVRVVESGRDSSGESTTQGVGGRMASMG